MSQYQDQAALPTNAVAIVGMSCRFAGARGLDAYWSLLRDGLEAVEDLDEATLLAAGVSPATLRKPNYVRRGAPIEDMECFDAALFGLSPRDAAIMDPQHRHFLECTWEAFENAGHAPQGFDGTIGVFAGSGHNAYMPRNLLTNPKLVRDVGLFLLRHTSNDKDFMTTRASYLFDLKGPSINVQTACSTSLVAIHMAAQSLLNGECDMAVAGGASIELPHRQGYLYEEGEILSPDGHCRPFDAQSQGTVFGSGVAVLALRRLEDAVAAGDHIWAVLRGSAINNDGAGKVGYLAPSVDGQARVIAEALAIADVSADTIDYVEAHGTGTPVGDPIEVAALTQAFRETTDRRGYCAIGSVKANIGHTDTAAGAAGVIKVALAMHHGERPASLNFTAPNPACAFEDSPFAVQNARTAWTPETHPRRAGVSSLGVGGTNAHVVLEEAPARAPNGPSRRWQLLPVSARSETSLRSNLSSLGAHLAAETGIDLADTAYTLSMGRQVLERRRAVVVDSATGAVAALDDVAHGDLPPAAIPNRSVAFLFCGAGAQHIDMARALYETEPLFRAPVDEALTLLSRVDAPDIRRWLFPVEVDREEAARLMERPSVALPALFIVQVALARFWMALGVRPSAMIGHSSGEYAAAHIAGVIDLEVGLRIVSARGALFETVVGGGMLSVPLTEAELLPILPPELAIAAINGPRLCVVSGPAHAIAAFAEELASREVEAQVVRISIAAHSGMLDPILPQFRSLIGDVRLQRPQIPFASNLTGDWISDAEVTDPGYWVRHLRQTVRFTDGLQRLFDDPERVLLEVGPGRSMSSLARQHPERKREQPVLCSLPHPDQPEAADAFLWGRVAQLWELGVAIDWTRYWAGERRHRIPLPTYRFDRVRHWIEPGNMVAPLGEADEDRRAKPEEWLYEPLWSRADIGSPTDKAQGPALVFEDDGGFGRDLTARLRSDGRTVVTVRHGSRFRALDDGGYEIRPGAACDYSRLLDQLSIDGRLPQQVYHCWLVDRAARRSRNAKALELGFQSLTILAPELARQSGDHACDIALVTDRAQRVCDERELVPEKSTAIGAARVISTEYPNLRIRSIDITSGTDPACIIDELSHPFDPTPVAYRSDERWTLGHAPARPRPAMPVLREGATYLITGGLGGLGLTIARHLVERYGASIALVSRTRLPARGEWSDLLADSATDALLADRIRRVIALEANGARIELVTADTADTRAMLRAVRQVRRKLGAIHGVFHTAGVLDDGLLETRTRSQMDAVLRPKVAGVRALEAALGREPAFLALFSSISAFAGLPGQVDYAAANAFLDAYAESRRHEPDMRVLAVGWSQWSEVGMSAGLNGSAGQLAIPMDGGEVVDHPFLERLHALPNGDYAAVGVLSPDTHWLLDEHRVDGVGALIPGTGYLELARAAHALIDPGPVALSEIMFRTPFVVPEGEARTLCVHLTRRGAHDWRFAILGRTAATWTEHASGIIRSVEHSDPKTLDIGMYALPYRIDGPSGRSKVLQFGPRWQNVRQTTTGAGEALLHLQLSPAFAADLDAIALHPALLDMATAGAQVLIPGYDPDSDFFAPFSYREISIRAALPARIVSHVRLRPAAPAAALAVFDVVIADQSGRVLVEIEEFTMMRVRSPALMRETSHGTGEAPTRATDGEQPLKALLPEEGIEALDLILSSAARPHVVVTPYALEHLLQRLRAPRRAAKIARSPEQAATDEPETPTERIIAELWEELLGIDGVGRHDDFFELGGHSLLAVQFTNRFRKRTGRALPLAMLLDKPTVANLARQIDPTEGTIDTDAPAVVVPQPVITIRSGRSGTPIFFVHDGLGQTLLYRSLALRLDADRPIYGIEPRRTATGDFAHTGIAQMASDYVERLQTVQPQGPYLIAGLCAGGVIAVEMAQQLEKAGQTVAFVGVMDAADVAAGKRAFYLTRTRLKRIANLIGEHNAIGLPLAIAQRAYRALQWEIGSRLRKARDRSIVSRMEVASPTQTTGESIPFLKLYEVAHRVHRPDGLLQHAHVALFKAGKGSGEIEDIPYQEIYSDIALGWGRRVAGEVRVAVVPGGHGSALQEPHVATLATLFQHEIDSAVARHDRFSAPVTVPMRMEVAA